jgi:mannose-6-phosphate isomerase-like protein (cupin superfamily)
MSVRHTPNSHPQPPSQPELETRLRAETSDGLRWWSTGAGDRFEPHTHPFRKVLFCAEGSITFHSGDGDVTLRPGDRLDVDAATVHSATTGSDGVTCVEARA